MNITAETLSAQIEMFHKIYPGFLVEWSNNSIVTLIGQLKIVKEVKGLHMCESYRIKICIPLNSHELPYVVDIDKVIDKHYHHVYASSRKLCLEADCIIRLEFIQGFDLILWMKKFVEPYFISYWYYQYTGMLPYGERSHGYKGILEAWKEVLNTPDELSALACLQQICQKRGKGHHICPCGSMKKMRNCHQKIILKFIENQQLYSIAVSDLVSIKNEMRNENDFKRYM